MSVGCTRVLLRLGTVQFVNSRPISAPGCSQLIYHACNIPSAACESPPEYEQVMLKICKGKGKAIPLQTLTGPEGSTRLRFQDFKIIGT
jgi:predicted secreted protein